MNKTKTKAEKIESLKQAIAMREKWLNAIQSGATSAEMKKMGIHTLPIRK